VTVALCATGFRSTPTTPGRLYKADSTTAFELARYIRDTSTTAVLVAVRIA
jgi:hypothetical protein